MFLTLEMLNITKKYIIFKFCILYFVFQPQLEQWYTKLKSAIYVCPSPKCSKPFKTHESLIPHLSVCKVDEKCSIVLSNNIFFCCICKNEVELNQISQHLKLQHQKVSVTYCRSFKIIVFLGFTFDRVVQVFLTAEIYYFLMSLYFFHQVMTNLSRFDLTHTVRCNYPCKQLFHDRGKYMRHAATCNFAGANTHHSVTKEVCNFLKRICVKQYDIFFSFLDQLLFQQYLFHYVIHNKRFFN